MRLYFLSLFALCISITVFAAAVAHRSEAADAATRIEVDQQANVIRFIIDGHERAVLDAAGLRVKGDIAFDGIITDTGGTRGTPGEDAADAQ